MCTPKSCTTVCTTACHNKFQFEPQYESTARDIPKRTPTCTRSGLTDYDARAHTLRHNQCPTSGGGATTADTLRARAAHFRSRSWTAHLERYSAGSADVDNRWILRDTCRVSTSVDVRSITATSHASYSGDFPAVGVVDDAPARATTAQPHHHR